MAIRLFIEYDNRLVQLPVNPPELTLTSKSNNDEVSIVKLGDVNILKGNSLSEIKIESFFPVDANAPYVLTHGLFKDPKYYIDFIKKIMDDKKPARFIVTDTEVNLMVSIEEFEHTRGSGYDDISYNIKLKEYREFGVKTVKIISAPNAGTPKAVTNNTDRPAKVGSFAIGDIVIANGKYFQDSYGGGRHGTFKNFTGKISHKVTKAGRKLPYHITDLQGGWKGWVALSQITHK